MVEPPGARVGEVGLRFHGDLAPVAHTAALEMAGLRKNFLMSDDVVVDASPADLADAAMASSVSENPTVRAAGGDDGADADAGDAGDDSFTPITSQEAFDSMLKARLERAQRSADKKYSKQIDELAAKLKEYEDAQLSVDEKKDKRLSELEQSLAEATERYTKLERTRLVESLAREMGLPEKFWSRVQGTSDDEIISDINDMLEGLPKAERTNGVLSQQPKQLSVAATGTEPDVEESPKAIVDKLGSMFPGF